MLNDGYQQRMENRRVIPKAQLSLKINIKSNKVIKIILYYEFEHFLP
jgi:hypothetical protein